MATLSCLGTAQPNTLKSVTDAPTEFPKGIGAPATRALEGAGYSRLEELADVPASGIAKRLHGMGPKALRLLQEALEENR